MTAPDAVVVGSGPNGLAAALTLARAGLEVEVLERAEVAGGGCRSGAATLDGYLHDRCSSVHPMAVASPFFATLDLAARGVTLRYPEVQFAHPLPEGRAAAVHRSLEATASGLGADARVYRRLLGPVVRHMDAICASALSPLRSVPEHPVAVGRFGLLGLLPETVLARRFATAEASALLAGAGAHSMRPLGAPLTGSFALLLSGLAHHAGWPVVEGGSQRITDALIAQLEELGGRVQTGRSVTSLTELPRARATFLDVTPRQLVSMAGDALPPRRRRAYRRFAYGPGACKVDWALSGPVPWSADACRRAATVHVGGTAAEVTAAELEVAAGRHPERPFCLVVQATVADPTRAPAGQHTLWAYCHVPNGSDIDMTARIESQIERFAPGFSDLVLARTTRTAAGLAAYDPSFVGGDIGAGAATVRQTIGRPALRWDPYRTGIEGVFLCSGSTPPGGGVHGMCGFNAASSFLRQGRG